MKPSLVVLAKPKFADGAQKFLQDHGLTWEPSADATDAEKLIEFSGRVCYLSFSPNPHTQVSTADYIQKLIRNGHESVLEHAQWTFLLDGITRGFSHQLVRHRVGFSFSQLSQQYHDEAHAELLVPEGLELHSDLVDEWDDISTRIHEFYSKAIETAEPTSEMSTRERMRYVRSFARAVLPNATRTVISVSANARSLRHFINVRGGLDGDVEMRRVSALIYDLLKMDAPSVVADYELGVLEDGSPKITRAYASDG